MKQTALQALTAKCAELGYIKGEDAKQFRARDPKAAQALAEWINTNMERLVGGMTGRLMRS